MLVALLLFAAVLAIAMATDRWRLPAYLTILFAALVFGLLADMNIRSIGTTFGQGFVSGLEQCGLLVVAGLMIRNLLPARPLATGGALALGLVAGIGPSAAGGLSFIQAVGGGGKRTLGILILAIMAAHALLPPSPLAVAALSVIGAPLVPTAIAGAGVALVVIIAAGFLLLRGLSDESNEPLSPIPALLVISVPLVLLALQSLAQMPSEPLGRGGAREFYIGISSPMVLLVLSVATAIVLRWTPAKDALADTSWAPLLLAVGAATGLGRMVDETGVAPLLAENLMRREFGLLAPFLAAAVVKTMQGSSLSAVLTASGMTEPMLDALGLGSEAGHVLAALACSAGAITVCHVNDPLFWILRHCTGQTTVETLRIATLGSAILGGSAILMLFIAAAII